MLVAFLVSQKLHHSVQQSPAVSKAMRGLLTNPHWLIFLVIAFANGVATSSTNNYFFPFLKELGAPEPEMPPFDEIKFEPMPEVEINPKDEFWVDPHKEFDIDDFEEES